MVKTGDRERREPEIDGKDGREGKGGLVAAGGGGMERKGKVSYTQIL